MEPRHIKNKHLRFRIVHQEVHFVEVHYSTPGPWNPEQTWNQLRKGFAWDIDRPERGRQTFSRRCDYCEKELQIEVDSLDLIASQRKMASRVVIVSAIVSLVLLTAGIIVGFNENIHQLLSHALGLRPNDVLVGLILGGLLSTIVLLLCYQPFLHQGYHTGILAELESKPTPGPYNIHFLEGVDSY